MDKKKIQKAIYLLLEGLGEDTKREGLLLTPYRVRKMWGEMEKNRQVKIRTFTNPGYDELVCKIGIDFWSFCEHHILPFFGTVDIAYLPNERVIGISKLARIVSKFASRLNIQEKMTADIAEFIMKELKPKGVMVIVSALHLCEVMRGVKNSGQMITSAIRGAFKENPTLKEEFLNLKGSG